MTIYTIKQYDTDRTLSFDLKIGTTPVDLTGHTVTATLKNQYQTLSDLAVAVVTPAQGSIQFALDDAAYTKYAGTTLLEFVVTDTGSLGVIRFPTDDYIYLDIIPAL